MESPWVEVRIEDVQTKLWSEYRALLPLDNLQFLLFNSFIQHVSVDKQLQNKGHPRGM